MSSPLLSQIKNRKGQGASANFELSAFDDSNDVNTSISTTGSLDISKIQNSNAVSSQLNSLIQKVNDQKDEINKDISEQQEKTKDFEMYQQRLSSMMKNGIQKEKEFHELIETNSQKAMKSQAKKASLESELIQTQSSLRSISDKVSQIQEQMTISQRSFSEQSSHKSEIFSKTLANKDKLIAEFQAQLAKAQAMYDKQMQLRLSAESEYKQKQELMMKMQDRLSQTKGMIQSKTKDPAKQAQVDALMKANALAKESLGLEMDKLGYMKHDLLDLKMRKEGFEQQKYDFEHNIDKLNADLEDKAYLEERLAKIDKSSGDLKLQQDGMLQKIEKKNKKINGNAENSEDLDGLLTLIQMLNRYERACQDLNDQLRDIENMLHILIENTAQIECWHLNNKDKLVYTLGKQKGESSTGGLGFLIKHALIEKKIDELKTLLLALKESTQIQKGKIEAQLAIIQSKPADKVTRQELDFAINVNTEVSKEISVFKQSVGEYQTSFNSVKSQFEISQERVRQSYITEVLERIKIADDDNVEGADRVTKALIIVNNFESEAEKYMKLIRNKDKKEEIRRLIQVGQKIKDDSNEVKANLQIRKNQLDKITKGTKDIDKMNLGKLIFILQDLRKLDNQIDNDKKDINDVERRAADMDGLFRDLIMGVIKDLFNEMSQKASQRSKKIVSQKSKHATLQDLLEKRRLELYNIQSQLEDDDKELLTLYKTYEGILEQANQEEDQASSYLRQLFSSDERIQKSVSIISKENINLEHVNEQIDQLDAGENILKNCQQKLDDSTSKAKSLELQLSELEHKIKLERINDCERAQKQTSDEHEKFKRLLDRLHTYLTVIEKDQNYMVDEFNDMEKKKESLAFRQEVDKKEREYTSLKVVKDKYYAQLTQQEKNYEEAQKNRDHVQSSEFLKMMRDSERLREEIKKVYITTQGPFNEELTACKEVVLRMVKKYKTKKEKYHDCSDLKIMRESDILQWKDRLLNMKDRIQMLEGQLSILGVSEEQEGAEIYKKFVQDIEILSSNTKNIEKQIQVYSDKISDESEDLNQMEIKIVKTARLDEIWKMLEQIGVSIEGYEKEIEKFDKLQKQIENEVDAFMNKIRSSQLFDCEQRIKEVEETIEKLIKKLHETQGDVSTFKQEIQLAQSTQNLGENKEKKFENRDQLVSKSEQFVSRVDAGQGQREKIEVQLMKLKSQLGGLDKKNVSMNEIYSILNEAQTIGSTATIEIKKANEVQEELRQLNLQWKENNKQAGERSVAQKKAKDLLRSNLEQLKNMRSKLTNNNDKTNNFEILYKSMLGSEDYAPKKARVEKKMRRMAQMKSEIGKFQEDQRVLDEWENKIKDINIDNIENMEQLNQIIKDSEKMAQTLATDVRDLSEMETGLIKKRVKVADAEIRNVSQRRKQELQQVADQLQGEMKRMQDFEQALVKRQQEADKDKDFSPEKQQMILQAQEQLRQQFSVFKKEYSNVEDEIRNITTDIDCRELETEEPLARLAKEIDKMQNKYVTIKALRSDLDKIQIDLTKKSSMLSSMDTENKLTQMLLDIEKDKEGLDGAKSLIGELIDVSKNYNGYTSGNEDDEFFQVVGSGGQDMNKELLTLHKNFSDVTLEIQRVIQMVEQKKAKSGGNMSEHEIEDLNDQIIKIEVKIMRYRKSGQEINAHASQSYESVSQHDLENKIDRRGEELLELERIILDILKDQGNVREKIQTEIDACQDDSLYAQYIIKLRDLFVMIDSIESQILPIKVSREDLLSQQRKLRGSIGLDSRMRFKIHYRNIELKRSIQMYLKQISEIHTKVKNVFTQTNNVFNAKPTQKLPVPQYKYDPKDEVDKMFGFFMAKLGLNLKIERLGGGYYMFGTKKIFCKIINGKLVVRVGGGYMGMEEFMTQYGPQETERLRQLNIAEENAANSNKNSQGSMGLALSVSSKVVKKIKGSGMDSPQSQRSLQSNDGADKSVGGTSSGMQLSVSSVGPSSFLKNAKEKQNFATALEEAKKAFKDEPVGGGADTKSSKVVGGPTLSVSVASTITKKVVKGKKGI